MKKSKIGGYYLIIAIYILSAIHYIFGVIYILGEYFLQMNLLPELVWDFLDFYFYKEAGPLRIAISVAIFIVLSILLVIFYRKDISKVSIILPATNLIISALWWTTAYWFSAMTDNTTIGYTIMSVVCVVHTVITGFFLIKERKKSQ